MRFLKACVPGLLLALASIPAPAAQYLELTGFQLIDGSGAAARPVQSLLARDGVIVALDAAGERPQPAAGDRWTRIALQGAWVLPGLVDTHVHLTGFADARKPERILRGALRGGVTGVRELAGDTRALGELQRALAAREWTGPTLVYSALFGGADIFRNSPTNTLSPGLEPGSAPWARRIDAATDLRQAVAEARGTGARNIKLYGGIDAKLAAALIREARRQGLATTAHATVFPAGPGDLVKAGVGSLAHAPYLVWEAVDKVPDDYGQRIRAPWRQVAPDHPRLLALYQEMARRGVFLDATLYIYKSIKEFVPPQVDTAWADDAFAWGAQATRLARAAGVRVTVGTDRFEPRDEGGLPNTHAEIALLVEAAGFTPLQAITAATRDGAAALGLQASHGLVEVGRAADLLVLDADPVADIHNTTRIRMTVKAGAVVGQPAD
jgi:imidazolonepropionase-like amidohydrolase